MISNTFPPSIGGVQTHVLELSKALVKIGHHVQVLTRKPDGNIPLRDHFDGVSVERLTLPNSHLLYDWLLRRRIRQTVRAHQIDIIHVHGMRPLNACRGLSIPVIFTNHTSSFIKRAQGGEKTRRKMLRQLEVASATLAVSEILIEKTKETGYQKPILFTGNGVDTSVFHPGESSLRTRLAIPESAYIIAIGCRLEPVKGVRFLAQAVAAIDDSRLHLVIAGEGSESAGIRDILKNKIKSGHAHFLGNVSHREMSDIYRGADASSLPSFMEGMSIAGLEAMASGLPLIASDVGGTPYIVQDGVTGILTRPGSSEGLTNAILRLLHNRELSRDMGSCGLKTVREQFTWEKIAQQTLTIYTRTLVA
ncbi:glycosyltransferase family 4 protein [Microbulbifer spongiae]|uniref:Glycosyltransferase family 4 protein n=1 Tax=Microbulbifer spongiae TaxID=2944933 RepID=A0ABY9EED5_9GAMM|nr:glycosyltransferase family 4 protein [Microbulbifer sp. MI-G]WKD50741.1 glycosyltransferase family 4 protein [Microbulbifer sp. MI-G]